MPSPLSFAHLLLVLTTCLAQAIYLPTLSTERAAGNQGGELHRDIR